MKPAGLESKLQVYGLHLRGVLELSDEDIRLFHFDTGEWASIALVGNIGSSYWSIFEQSPEYKHGQLNPLDGWSRRIGEQLADELGAKAIYPFDGPPYYPFQQWAKRADSLEQSLMGLMIHPEYGLWHSYRFGLLIPELQGSTEYKPITRQSPCESCVAQPCLSTCPVGAFETDGYDVDSCAAYLKREPGARCLSGGCLARLSCPVGEKFVYRSTEHIFHLRAFLAGLQVLRHPGSAA